MIQFFLGESELAFNHCNPNRLTLFVKFVSHSTVFFFHNKQRTLISAKRTTPQHEEIKWEDARA